MGLDVRGVPEEDFLVGQGGAFEGAGFVEHAFMEALRAELRQKCVPIQFVFVAGIVAHPQLQKQPAPFGDVPRQGPADDGHPLPVGRGKSLVPLVAHAQMNDVELLQRRQQFRFRTVVPVEQRLLQQCRLDAVFPIDGQHPVVLLELGVAAVRPLGRQTQADGLGLLGPRERHV